MSLRPDLQQWYSFFLTKQETAQAFRTGFVAIRLSDTFDSCTNSVVDAIECYAIKATAISSWLPCSVQSVVPSPSETEEIDGGPSLTPSLSLSLEALAEIGSTLRPLKPLGESQVGLLRRLVTDAVVAYSPTISDSVDAILGALNWDGDAQDAFRDNAILDGCHRFLQKCHELLGTPLNHSNWHQVSPPLQCCLLAASKVVANRPLEYRAYFGNGSTLGDTSSRALVECFKLSDASLTMIPDLVDLCCTCIVVGTRVGMSFPSFPG